jgi:hypothetical protein
LKKGNIVCLLAGSNYPVILRKQGECYVFIAFYTLYRDSGELDEISFGRGIDSHANLGDIMSGKLWKDMTNSGRKLRCFDVH